MFKYMQVTQQKKTNTTCQHFNVLRQLRLNFELLISFKIQPKLFMHIPLLTHSEDTM